MFSSLTEILEIFRDKYYHEVRSYLKKIKTEEPTKQFESNYAARSVVEQMQDILNERIENCEQDSCNRENSILSALYYIHGCISMDVDENHSAQQSLHKSLKLIEQDPVSRDNILTVISCYNQLALLWCSRSDFDKATEYLKQSEEFYDKYPCDEDVTDFELLITGVEGSESGRAALERLHTLTSYYLAQSLGSLGQSVSAAAYCHRTLQRQLIWSDLDKGDWALNAATLSQVLVEHNAFKEAKNHLMAASHKLKELRSELDNSPDHDSEEHIAQVEVLNVRRSEVYRCWIKYCLNLLTVSKERLLDDCQPSPPPQELEGLVFDNLTDVEEGKDILCTYVLMWEDALSLYKHASRWIDEACKFYTLENHASDHVNIVMDHSQIYLMLAFFTDDLSKQCKMHKKRIDMLTSMSQQLNAEYYIDLLRQLWFELSETYIIMIDLKNHQMANSNKNGNSTTNDYNVKINNFVKQGVSTLQKFIDSFKDHKGNTRYSETYERSILLSRIHQAQLLIKIKSDDPSQILQYNTMACDNYKEVVDYMEKWKNVSKALTEGELSACQQMSLLLPLKISKLLKTN